MEESEYPAIPESVRIPAPRNADETPGRHEKRGVRKRKNRHLMLKLIAGWSLVLLLIVLGAKRLYEQKPAKSKPTTSTKTETGISDLDRKLLEEAGPKCINSFSGFLAAGTPEERNQFVLSPVATASRMARFYSLNPITNVDPRKLRLETNAVMDLPGGKGIETRWISSDEKHYDALFREENGEWRLDWDHFARYSDYPWALFLAGSGPAEGEFRLLARERLAEERKDAATVSVVLYAPRFGQPGDTGFQSPEFLVSRNKPEGRMLDAAFKLARKGGQVFGSTLPNLNPEGMIRLRVKVKRIEADLERRFEITAITACHWYSIEDPGVELPPDPEAPPAPEN